MTSRFQVPIKTRKGDTVAFVVIKHNPKGGLYIPSSSIERAYWPGWPPVPKRTLSQRFAFVFFACLHPFRYYRYRNYFV